MRLSFLSFLFILITACNTPSAEGSVSLQKARTPEERLATWWQKVRESEPMVKDGDLITRTGSDIISASLCNFNKQDKTYSHSGVAFIEDGEAYVYHTMAGDENPTGVMMRQPFDSFCNPSRKNGFGIFRYDLSGSEMDSFRSLIINHYQNKMIFDTTFDLKDDNSMYCAEIIYKGLKVSTQNRIILPTTTVRNYTFKQVGYESKTLKELEYVALDNLYMNPHCREIARVKFD